MRAVVQRVTRASVTVSGETVGAVGPGIMVLIGVADTDTDKDLKYITDKVPNLRIFDDENGVMNRSVLDTGGSILVVSYERLVAAWREKGIHVETGRFRTEMQVSLVNDGPVTILLDSEKAF